MTTDRIELSDTKIQNQALLNDPEFMDKWHALIAGSNFIKNTGVLETALKDYYNVDYAIPCSSGTAALYAALMATDVRKNGRVATPSMTFYSIAEVCELGGWHTRMVDIDANTWIMNPTDAGRFVDAIVPVALYGYPIAGCWMTECLNSLGGNRFVPIIVDAAQAHGQKFDSRMTAMTLSFYPGKVLGAWGDGGAILTNDVEVAKYARACIDHGRLPGEKYERSNFGFNFRMSAEIALVLAEKYKRLDEWLEKRRTVAGWYYDALGDYVDELFQLPSAYMRDIGTTLVDGHSWHLFVVKLIGLKSQERDEIVRSLREIGIQAGIHYPTPLHRQPNLSIGESLPVTEDLANKCVSLPIHPGMTQSDVEKVSAELVRLVKEVKSRE